MNPILTLKNNILPLFNIIEFCNQKKTKLIFFSTSEVYSPMIKKNKIKFPLQENNNIELPLIISKRTHILYLNYFVKNSFSRIKINI